MPDAAARLDGLLRFAPRNDGDAFQSERLFA
jgi:hypothetical protein